VRILLDESVPRQLTRFLKGHEVQTVPRRGWAGVRNDELLRRAATEFDVFVTVDQNLQHQQNLSRFPVAVAVLVVHDNRIETLEPLAPLLLSVLPSLQAGRATEITP
jgi:predicted nuclease of predicted toxin-antitoxin system